MKLSKCPGCMEDFSHYPCPNCGYDPSNAKNTEYALSPETILAGKYLVGKVLGQGGFGITYIGWDIALERKVAIKEYYPSGHVSRSPGTLQLTWYSSEPSQAARQDGMQIFLKEARKMVKVENIPGVVRVLDLFQENGTAYIVMEYVQGTTLKTYLQKNGPMPWEKAKQIFYPVISAMEQVHQAGLVHRDLSPDNLMLTPTGDVKILDLGAAKDLSINSGASSMQVAKSGFSPLEQYVHRGSSGPWTDVYAMAATIYYTITGTLPPNAVDRLACDTLSWAEPGLKLLPAAARDALQKALTVQFKNRTQSMHELEQGLFSEEAPTFAAQKQESAVQKAPTEKHSKSAPSAWLVPTVAILVVCLLFGALLPTMASKSAGKRDSTETIPVSDSPETTASPAYDAPNDDLDSYDNSEVQATDATAEPSNYIDSLQGDWQTVSLDSSHTDASAIVFTQKIRCTKMTVNIKIEMNYGARCKDWELWVRIDGQWKNLEQISLPDGNGSTTHTVAFDTPANLDAVSITPTIVGGYSWTEWLWLSDIWTAE